MLRSRPVTAVREGLFAEGADPHLIGARCRACGRQHFPASDTCPYCGVDAVDPCELPAVGRLWAWTAVTSPPPGYHGAVPYGFGVVELVRERLRIITRLREPDPARLEFGRPMTLVADELPDGVVTWAFA